MTVQYQKSVFNVDGVPTVSHCLNSDVAKRHGTGPALCGQVTAIGTHDECVATTASSDGIMHVYAIDQQGPSCTYCAAILQVSDESKAKFEAGMRRADEARRLGFI